MRTMVTRVRYLASLLPVTLLASALQAQRIEGTIRVGGAPAAGTLIAAYDSTGRAIAEAATRDDGGFYLFVDSTATVTIRVMRPGALAHDILTRRFRDGEVERLTIDFSGAAIALPGDIDKGASTCRGRMRATDPLALLVEEARKTLRIAQLRIGRPEDTVRYVTFNHRTAKNGEDTLRTAFRRQAGLFPTPFEPTATELLEKNGFFGTVGGERVFRAGDPELFAGPWFRETHCLSIRRVTADSVIVAFAPSRERKGLVDVEGEYVFERRSLALRRITYRYQGLPNEEAKSDAGGRLDFARATNGDVFLAEWDQRVPLLGYRQGEGKTTFVRSSMTLIDITGHRSIGGTILATFAAGRATFQRDPLPRPQSTTPFGMLCPERLVAAQVSALQGRILNDSGAPIPGVIVRAQWQVPVVVDRTQMAQRELVRETVTATDGSWTLCDVAVKRDAIVRWEVQGKEVAFPVPLVEPLKVVEVAPPKP